MTANLTPTGNLVIMSPAVCVRYVQFFKPILEEASRTNTMSNCTESEHEGMNADVVEIMEAPESDSDDSCLIVISDVQLG